MEKEYNLGRISGLRLSVGPSFMVGTILLWILFSGVGMLLLDLRLTQAIGVGFIATLLYWLSELVHQLGHAYAAHRTGYPMIGIHLGNYLVLGRAVYPENEEPLPAEIHIRRALGGPMISFALSLVSGGLALLLYPARDLVWWFVVFVCTINLIVFTIGSFLPLGFTDGSTLLKWWGKR